MLPRAMLNKMISHSNATKISRKLSTQFTPATLRSPLPIAKPFSFFSGAPSHSYHSTSLLKATLSAETIDTLSAKTIFSTKERNQNLIQLTMRKRFEEIVDKYQIYVESALLKKPKVFISHAWGDGHENWLDFFVKSLKRAGITVSYDKYDLGIGERQIRNIVDFVSTLPDHDRILLIGTNRYLEKATWAMENTEDIQAPGLIFEIRMIRDKFSAYNPLRQKKLLGIVLEGQNNENVFPSELLTNQDMSVIFSVNDHYEKFFEVLHGIYDIRLDDKKHQQVIKMVDDFLDDVRSRSIQNAVTPEVLEQYRAEHTERPIDSPAQDDSYQYVQQLRRQPLKPVDKQIAEEVITEKLNRQKEVAQQIAQQEQDKRKKKYYYFFMTCLALASTGTIIYLKLVELEKYNSPQAEIERDFNNDILKPDTTSSSTRFFEGIWPRWITPETHMLNAAQEGNLAEIKLELTKLESHKIDINSRRLRPGDPFYSCTALMIAAYRGHHEIVRELIKNGADPFVKNIKGKTAQDLAIEAHHVKTYTYLKSYEALFESAIRNRTLILHDKASSPQLQLR